MRTRKLLPKLIFLMIPLALLLLALCTPIGGWFAQGVSEVWQAFVKLPGITWLREQMAAEGSIEGASLEQETEGIDALLEAGRAFQEQQAYEKALEHYREALQRNEEYAPTHVALAGLYLQLGKKKKAIQELERAAELAPDNKYVLGELGRLYLEEDEYDKAVDVLEKAKKVAPDEAIVRYWLGLAYQLRSFSDAEQAVEELEQAARLEPDRAEVYYHLGMAYLRRDDEGDEQRAIGAFRKVTELDPQEADAYFYLGRLYLKSGEREAAVAAWRQYVAKAKDEEKVSKVRGWLQRLEEETP
ncbi:MAG: tetratricopeptide repeat protein [Anaerolineae bacterium]|nr:tetratricopeptide repeat protein [Anaerolineae bacterium]